MLLTCMNKVRYIVVETVLPPAGSFCCIKPGFSTAVLFKWMQLADIYIPPGFSDLATSLNT